MTEFTLAQLAAKISGKISGNDVVVSSLTANSTEVSAGGLFVAVPGTTRDGHDFLDAAFAAGAAAAVVTRAETLRGRPGIVVSDARQALSRLAALFAGSPARNLSVIGITGTNGKTTTNWFIYHALNRLNSPAIRIGTIGIQAEGVLDLPGILTTPDPVSLHQHLAHAVAHGVQSCVIEAGSHGLDQKRIEDLEFDVGVFTNLTRDHLDYHQTMENYLAAKAHLFELVRDSAKKTKAMVCNLESSEGVLLRKRFASSLNDFSFGPQAEAPVRIVSFVDAESLTLSFRGKDFTIKTPVIGSYNGQNLAAAFAACCALGFAPERVAEALSGVPAAPGRLDLVSERGVRVFVDYAHTPDALERALYAVRPITTGKLWAIFGCGGDRDRGKRPIMGEIAARLADRVVLTSDNPRTEEPAAILAEIESGIPVAARKGLSVEIDRRKAIQFAIGQAVSGDVILLAGKGHEDYQVLGTTKHHFSDQEEVRKAFSSR